jgi:hypothetical protein
MKILIVMTAKFTAGLMRKSAGLDRGFVTNEGPIGVGDRASAS